MLAPQQLIVRLEQVFEEMVGIVCHTLKNRACSAEFFAGMPLKSELMWLVNAHRFALRGLYAGAGNADYVQNCLLRYLLRVWNSYRHHFRKLARHMRRLFAEYARCANLLRSHITAGGQRFLLPVIVPDQVGQTALFWHMAEDLRRALHHLALAQAALPYHDLPPAKTLSEQVQKFSRALADMQTHLVQPAAADSLCPQSWLYEVLCHIHELHSLCTPFFVLSCANPMWEQIDALHKIVVGAYPGLLHIEKNYARVEAEQPSWRYLDIFARAHTESTHERPYYRQEATWFTLQYRKWQAVRLPSDYDEEMYPALQQLVMLYLKNKDQVLYDEVIRRLWRHCQPSVEDMPWLTVTRRDAVKEVAYAVLRLTQGKAGVEIIETLRPLLLHFEIDLVWARNVKTYAADASLVEHQHVFAEPPGNYLKQNGVRVDDGVLQRAIYLHKIWPRPQCLGTLASVRDWLAGLPCKDDRQAARGELRSKLEALLLPLFWSEAADRPRFQEQKLLPALREVVCGIDTLVYGEIGAYDKKQRADYERLLALVAKSLVKDGWQIVLQAGKCVDRPTRHHRLPGNLAPAEWQPHVEIGYPLPAPDFRRPLYTVANPCASRFCYCRAYTPAILQWCRRHLPPALAQLQNAMDNLAQAIVDGWPEQTTALSRQLLDCLVNPLAQMMNEQSADTNLWRQARELLQDLRQIMASDHMPLFWPEPAFVGSVLGTGPLAPGVEVRYLASHAPKGTVLAIVQYGLDWKQVKIQVSGGPADEELTLFADTLAVLHEFCRHHPELLADANKPPQPMPAPDVVKSGDLTGLPHIWPVLIPELLPWTLRECHEFYARYNGEFTVDKLRRLATLLALCDQLCAVFFPETDRLREIAERLARHLDANKIAVDPLTLTLPKSHGQSWHVLWPQAEVVAVARRRIAGHSSEAIVLVGNPRPAHDDAMVDGNSEEILRPLRRLYSLLWCHLKRIADPTLRVQAVERWQAVYYQLQAKARLPQLLELINLVYEYGEMWHPTDDAGNYREVLLPIERFLVGRGVVLVQLEAGEIFSDCHAAYFDRQPSLLPHSGPANSVIRIVKPAFFHRQENRLLQRGKLLLGGGA